MTITYMPMAMAFPFIWQWVYLALYMEGGMALLAWEITLYCMDGMGTFVVVFYRTNHAPFAEGAVRDFERECASEQTSLDYADLAQGWGKEMKGRG